MTGLFIPCNPYLERDSGRDRRQHGYVEFHGKSRRKFHLDEVAQLLEVLELGRDYLQKIIFSNIYRVRLVIVDWVWLT